MLTRRTKAYSSSSSAENWGVHTKLIYKYQPEIAKKSIKPPILAFRVIQGHWIRRQSRASVRLPISD